MSKCELEALLSSADTVLLYGLRDAVPFAVLLASEDWKMAFFEQFDLVAHVD